MLATSNRVNVLQTGQAQQGRHRAANLLAEDFLVALPGQFGRAQRSHDAQGHPGRRTGSIDREVDTAGQGLNPIRFDAPAGQPVLPHLGRLGRGLFLGLARLSGFGGIDPRLEIGRQQIGKMQQQVGQVALWIDHQSRDPIERGFLQQIDTQTSLAGTGHADDDAMGGQVLGIITYGLCGQFSCLWVPNSAQIILPVKVSHTITSAASLPQARRYVMACGSSDPVAPSRARSFQLRPAT